MAKKSLHERIWRALHRSMDAIAKDRPSKANWRKELEEISVDDRRSRRDRGETFQDSEVFEALLLSVLSSGTDWSRIQRVRSSLAGAAVGFDPQSFAKLNSTDGVHCKLNALGVNSQNLGRMLAYLRETIGKLLIDGREYGGIDRYITSEFNRVGSAERLALSFGLPGEVKWKGFGVPLAAEALRNIGYDLAKPDRHILRAVGCWGLVDFPRWDPEKSQVPPANPENLLETMHAIKAFAADIGQSVSLTDTTIWYVCSRGGGHLTNEQLRQLAA